ncbi:MAG TPA: hypothetical protein VG298_17740 [Acidimicrobiales bacterium]|jgi:hypothetical protein|nr:hypothetical protein [Acidimicrobiales bacterium]
MDRDAEPTTATRDTEREDARQAHIADRAPTAEEEVAAERGRSSFGADRESVAEHYDEMTEIGAKVKGEGEVE